MHTLVPAPPRRKPVNWYRVMAWLVPGVFIIFLFMTAIFAWPQMWHAEPLPAPPLWGSQLLGSFVNGVGTATLSLGLTAAMGLGLWLAWKIFLGTGLFCFWWYDKMKETDRKNANLTYED